MEPVVRQHPGAEGDFICQDVSQQLLGTNSVSNKTALSSQEPQEK